MQRERDGVPLSERTGRLSANGRFVALISAARLVERDLNDLRDVYVFDGETGGLTLETLGHLGQPADGESRAVDISADGRFVVFAAEAGNLIDPSFAPGTSHIFLRDRIDGKTRLLTVSAKGDPANGPSRGPAIDAAGTTVAFQSGATDLLAPGPANGIFLVSVASGTITRVDEAADGSSRPGASMSPAMAAVATERVYLTIDVDGFDPAVAPATGTPVPGGISWAYGTRLLRALFLAKDVVGADVVEVAPVAGSALTEYAAAQLCYDILCYQLLKRDGKLAFV